MARTVSMSEKSIIGSTPMATPRTRSWCGRSGRGPETAERAARKELERTLSLLSESE
ncbi:hypothetical protein [Streptomyces tsukubensis]|uniref:hypothetical protein n=1 Tax=Streptomyces tsukubensis TaxID=83656 RepID=UPI003869CDAF